MRTSERRSPFTGLDEPSCGKLEWPSGSDDATWLRGGDRDEAIRQAAAAGLSLSYIQRITGLGKTTIMRILNHRPRPRA
jgi:hypothetical protein